MASNDLIGKTASEIIGLLKSTAVSPLELLDALEARIAEVDGAINALPTLCFERARAAASELMKKPVIERGPLAGMPLPIKDLVDVAGVRSTMGSPIFADRVPDASDVLVSHLESNGGIVYAKSNTPEFGAGGNTFNEVFGQTRNPWNTELSAAGSSGGAAAALASGTAWLAQGSDMGGSLRNPASFCGVVGLRPSPGRVAYSRTGSIAELLAVEGPMARNVEDVALLFDAMLGEEPADPLSLPFDGQSMRAAALSGWKPARVAFSRDLGITPVDPEVSAIVEKAAARLADAGIPVEEAQPDLSDVNDCFQTLRALAYAVSMKPHFDNHRDKLKPEVVWNIEKGLALGAEDIVRAENQRAAMFDRARAFFATYDVILTPATIVAPYPVSQRFVETCNGHTFANYIEWLSIAYAFTTIASPAMSIPAGFTAAGLPVGLQIAGPCRGERKVLATARLIEDILGHGALTPIRPRPANTG